MSKDGFWHSASHFARSFGSVSDTIARTAQAEDIARIQTIAAEEAAKAEAERLRIEAANAPQKRKCNKCGDMTFNPCG